MSTKSRSRTHSLVLISALTIAGAGAVLAQHPKVTLDNGHISPVKARVTYGDGKTQDGLIVSHMWGGTHKYEGANASGGTVDLWMDSLSSIKDPDDDGVTVTLKNGTERHLGWHGGTQTLKISNEDGGTEDIDVHKVKKIDFLKPPRKDKLGNAMFDNWKYSPFTGEKLTEDPPAAP